MKNSQALTEPLLLSVPLSVNTASVQELILPKIAGVYMLYGRWSDSSENGPTDMNFYIGESADVIRRIKDHEDTSINRGTRWLSPFRSVLLCNVADSTRKERVSAESRFIAAARRLGLPLTNDKRRALAESSAGDLAWETERTQQALQIFGYCL